MDTAPRPSAPALELLTIGNELLLGETIDTNAAWLGQRLAEEGIRVARRATVADEAPEIRAAMAQALERTGVLLCTGGLGPTRDDVTRAVAAQLFGRTIRVDPELLARLEARFAAMGRPMAESNRSQAEVPDDARVLPNRRGSAPGIVLEREDGALLVLLPGVPVEMRAMLEESVIPLLRERWPERGRPIRHHVLRTTGIPESELADRLDDVLPELAPLGVAFLPSWQGVDLRLTSWAALSEDELETAFRSAEQRVRERAGRYVYGTGTRELADAVADALRSRALTLALAESCTGGLLAERLTSRPGASDYLLGGVVAYANAAKVTTLGVDENTLERDGAVSEYVALEMARGARSRFGADAAVSITGIAGPGGGSAEKPVGTVWVGVALGTRERTWLLRLNGEREEIRERSAQAALAGLWRLLVPPDDDGDHYDMQGTG